MRSLPLIEATFFEPAAPQSEQTRQGPSKPPAQTTETRTLWASSRNPPLRHRSSSHASRFPCPGHQLVDPEIFDSEIASRIMMVVPDLTNLGQRRQTLPTTAYLSSWKTETWRIRYETTFCSSILPSHRTPSVYSIPLMMKHRLPALTCKRPPNKRPSLSNHRADQFLKR